MLYEVITHVIDLTNGSRSSPPQSEKEIPMSKLTLTVSVVALCAALGACTHESTEATETAVTEAVTETPAVDPNAAEIAEAIV